MVKGIRQQPINLVTGSGGLSSTGLLELCGALFPLVLGKSACIVFSSHLACLVLALRASCGRVKVVW